MLFINACALINYFILGIPVKFSKDSSSQHILYVKEHSVKLQTPEKPGRRTLFVTNVPPYATEQSFKHIFSEAGKVTSVIFERPTNTGFKTAYVVFKTPEQLYKATQLNVLKPLSLEKQPIQTGISKWVSEYNKTITNQQKLQQYIKKVIQSYDKEEYQRKLKEGNNKTDDEGWTVVTKKGRTPGLSRKKSVTNKINEKIKNKQKVLKNFYRFQIRESKMNHLASLRKKFEEDKKKINLLKQSRKFKPF